MTANWIAGISEIQLMGCHGSCTGSLDKSPLLAPDYFRNNDLVEGVWVNGSLERSVDSQEDARSVYCLLKKCWLSKKRKRNFVFGALYKVIRMESVYLINAADAKYTFHIQITLPDSAGATTSIGIASARSEKTLLSSIGKLTSKLPKKGNARRDSGDEGEMFALGIRSHKKQTTYAPTNHAGVSCYAVKDRHPKYGFPFTPNIHLRVRILVPYWGRRVYQTRP
jgi:hypothetical protein